MSRRARHVIEPALQEELLKHPGKWVAMTRTKLIAVGDSPKEVIDAAEALGVRDTILHCVPEPGVGWFFATVTA